MQQLRGPGGARRDPRRGGRRSRERRPVLRHRRRLWWEGRERTGARRGRGRLGVGVLPYFPLSSGRLTGKYRRGEPAPEGTRLYGRGDVADATTFDRLEAAAGFAAARGLELVQVAIGGLAAQPMVVSVIAGATTPEQVRTNATAADWEPTPEDLAARHEIFPSP